MYQCWKIFLFLGLFFSGCLQVSRPANPSGSEDQDGWAVDVKRMEGTQIIQIMCDANLDGKIDGIVLCDLLGAEGIRTLIDSDFDGKFDMQSFEIYDAQHHLESFYYDLNYDGVLDVTVNRARENSIYYEGKWVRVRIKRHYDPLKARALDSIRTLKKDSYEIERDGEKVRLYFDHEKGFVESQ
ncbi:MAG: hypothetical protein AMS15_09225 [Planctomycetes bacterium DG_23]|nr:MAG: hypothetical protein AMS15_09225 [Planctomycetes bacterium DG_23]